MARTLACRTAAIFVVFAFLTACTALISPFSEEAYRTATHLKARSLALIDKSSQPYTRHAEQVEELLVDVDGAYEYARGLPQNRISTELWDTLRDPDGNLLGGFARQWRERGKLSDFFKAEIKAQVAAGFDQIICVEINKRQPSACDL